MDRPPNGPSFRLRAYRFFNATGKIGLFSLGAKPAKAMCQPERRHPGST